MLVELALRGRLQLEPCGVRRKGLLSRKVSQIADVVESKGEERHSTVSLDLPTKVLTPLG